MSAEVEVITACRSCREPDLETVLSLGETPLADALLDEAALGRPEPRYPLTLAFCKSCSLLQLTETVAPEIVFGADYPYYSSFSDTLCEHSRRHVERLVAHRDLGPESLVVEIASNDGYLLRYFAAAGIPVLGIDPAPGPASAAREAGVPTLGAFFGLALAENLRARGIRADVIIANNVLAHVADLNGFVAGIAVLLADDGIADIEVPYVWDLIEHCEFDTIYHEHLCYFSVTALSALFHRHGLVLTGVERLPIHGGSLRLSIARADSSVGAGAADAVQGADGVEHALTEEAAVGLTRADYYRSFATRVDAVKVALRTLLVDLRADGRRIAAYGAAAKGATLLNVCRIGAELIDFVVDRNVHKQGRYLPGARVPIRAPAALVEEMPDDVLLLAWNFADEIVAQQEAYRSRGGRFIIPIPEPRVL